MKSQIRRFLAGLFAVLAGVATAATFNLFQPATGVLKGNASTYVTTAATSADIRGLWTGTCDVTTFLRGDGACAAVVTAPAGANTQIQYNNSGAFGASGNLTFTSATNVLNVGASNTPGTFSIGQLDTMVVNGVAVPVPGLALNSNVQGVIENHSYVSGGPTGGARYYGARSRGSISSPTVVQNGDNLSSFFAVGYNGSAYSIAGRILFSVGNTPGAADMPGDLDFLLSPDGSETPTSKLKLYNTGSFGVNGSQGTAGNSLLSGGTGPAAWGAVNLASAAGVTGTLPVGNGGTGATTLTGIIKGNGTSPFSTATSADVIGLWTGTCDSSTFLRADGACATVGAGSVTSVALTMPGVFSVTGSPVTTSGTLAVAASGTSGGVPYFNSATTMLSSAALSANQIVLGGGAGAAPASLGALGTTTTVLHGNAAGAPTFGAVSLTADVSGTLPVGNGGTGVTSSTGTGSVVLSASPALTGAPTVGGQNICLADGTNCPASTTPKIVWGQVGSTGTVIVSGTYGGATFSGVTKGATGKYSLSMGGFSSGVVCTCSATQSSAGYICQNDAASGQILTSLISAGTPTATDVGFQFHCIGS